MAHPAAVNEATGFVPTEDAEDRELDVPLRQAGTTRAISAAASGP